MDALINELQKEIVEQLNLQDIKPEDIKEHEPLFGEGLGLDSIDALELIVLLQKKYGIKLGSAEEGKEVFYSVHTMANFIRSKSK
ncbi:MAG: phosphopantetheine-binding protein [Bacteroidota bacterium]